MPDTSQVCDPPRPLLTSEADMTASCESALKRLTSNTESGVFETQSSVESTPEKENIAPVSRLNIQENKRKASIIKVNNPKIITPLEEIDDNEKEEVEKKEEGQKDIFVEKADNETELIDNAVEIGRKIITDDNDRTIIIDAKPDSNTETEDNETEGDSQFSEVESCFESLETEEEINARYEAWYEEAKNSHFHTPWNLYYVTKMKGKQITIKEYSDGRTKYPTIETVADFWQTVQNTPLASELRVSNREDLYLFRNGIQPEWEDKSAAGGGIFRLEITDKHHRNTLLDQFWMSLMLEVVGENFIDTNLITGVIISRRQKEDKLCIWTRDLEKGEDSSDTIKKRIADQFRKFLGIGEGGHLQYITHAENMGAANNGKWSDKKDGFRDNKKHKKRDHNNNNFDKHHREEYDLTAEQRKRNLAKPPINLKSLTKGKTAKEPEDNFSGAKKGINITLPSRAPKGGSENDSRNRKLSSNGKNNNNNNRKKKNSLRSDNIVLMKRGEQINAENNNNSFSPNYLK